MVVNTVVEQFMYIGFSEYEARAYVGLLEKNPATAYELAMTSGIPTSKIYEVIPKLSGKGMVSALAGKGKKRYVPIRPDEFIENFGSKVHGTLKLLKHGLSDIGKGSDTSYIWNIRDYDHLMDKAERMAVKAEKTLLVSIWKEEMAHLEGVFKKAEGKGVGIAVVHFGTPHVKTGRVFHHPIEHTIYKEKGGRGLAVIADSKEALTGTVLNGNRAEGAWSTNQGFVNLAEDYIKHDIYIMKVVKRFDRELGKMFGNNYEKLRDVFSDRENL